MSSVGSGSVLFTPRVGAEYGYELLWLLWGVAFLMWVMIREAGRFAVLTGRTLLDGFSSLPGPRNWAVWVVLVPQIFAAVVGIGGLSALVGSALADALPGSLLLWSLVVLAGSTSLVITGGYRGVSRAALGMALVLLALTVAAAGRVISGVSEPASGLVPGLPDDLSVPFVLPWIGTILAGSMGIVWFSYWTATRGFGGETGDLAHGEGGEQPGDGEVSDDEREERLGRWVRTMSVTALLGVVTGTIVITAFLVLGAELLRPEGIVPSGLDVATDLTRLLSDIWGRSGYWLMTGAIVVALGGSVLANQDGWSRSFADMLLLLPLRRDESGGDAQAERRAPPWMRWLIGWRPDGMGPRRALKIAAVVVVTAIAPAAVIIVVRDPVAIMSASGIVATIHTPFIVIVTLAVNRRLAPAGRPGALSTGLMALAGIFYSLFAAAWFADLAGLIG